MTLRKRGDFKAGERSFTYLKRLSPPASSSDPACALMEQVHSSNVFEITSEKAAGKILAPRSDGIILRTPVKIALGVRVADCQAVFAFYRRRLLGAFHAGWRGLSEGIGGNFIALAREVGAEAGGISFFTAPHICPSCYEVGDEVGDLFPVAAQGGKLDLFRALGRQLVRAGARENKIRAAGGRKRCTLENREYFSHRGGDTSRMLAFAIQR